MNKKGFTLLEVIVGIAVLFILTALALPAARPTREAVDVQSSADEIISVLLLAKSRTIASESASQHGVFFNAATNSYTLFEGSDYASRNVLEDEMFNLSTSVEIASVSFGGGEEIVFDRIYGTTVQSGFLTIQLVSDLSVTADVSVSSLGQVGGSSPSAPSDSNRVVDSRHVHLEYVGRNINTATENIVLTFLPSATTEVISIASNIWGGQIFWEGTVLVDGEDQELKIHTHRLNDLVLGTQFSIHRDRRFNTKALVISLSEDVSGEIISYNASGLTTQGTSIYVSAPDSQ